MISSTRTAAVAVLLASLIACDGNPVAPPPPEPVWTQVAEWTGTGTALTEAFTAGRAWRVVATGRQTGPPPTPALYVYRDGGEMVAGMPFGEADTLSVNEAGAFRIFVLATHTAWAVTVEERR